MTIPTWILIRLGIALVVTAIVVAVIVWATGYSRRAVVPSAAPSVAPQLEDLSRLKEQGIISAEEFDAKRAELMSRL